MSYCTKCGAKKGKEGSYEFNAKSGNKEYKEFRLKNICHNGHDWEYIPSTPFCFWRPDKICRKCGYKVYLD